MGQAGHAAEVTAEPGAAALDLDGDGQFARELAKRSCPKMHLVIVQARIGGQALELAEAIGGGGAGRQGLFELGQARFRRGRTPGEGGAVSIADRARGAT